MVLLGLGGNVAGRWGDPATTLERALVALERSGVRVLQRSPLMKSPPLGPVSQPAFLNCAALVETHRPPLALLGLIKRLERDAGRRDGRRWGPRPLDIDILDYKGRIAGWLDYKGRIVGWERRRAGRQSGGPVCKGDARRLILPHGELHRRTFVLLPILEIAADWHHPVLGLRADRLLALLPPRARTLHARFFNLTD